jgi:predicted nucleotidyltransferase component of viral defense system
VIPRDYITEWRREAPWVRNDQVEQDLVISRALVDIFSHPPLQDAVAVRGGTALYKLHITPAARYSEDIDLVQTKAEAAGSMMHALREILDPWLGVPKWKQTEGRVTFAYRFDSEDVPPRGLRLKVEINTREHFSALGLTRVPFSVSSRWFQGSCEIATYELDELLGTKLRALYQRKAGRDLLDLAVALGGSQANAQRIVTVFLHYMEHGGHNITRALFEQNLAEKMGDPEFLADISPLLSDGYGWDPAAAAALVSRGLIELLPGDPWKRGVGQLGTHRPSMEG